jgi:hypothetical protein
VAQVLLKLAQVLLVVLVAGVVTQITLIKMDMQEPLDRVLLVVMAQMLDYKILVLVAVVVLVRLVALQAVQLLVLAGLVVIGNPLGLLTLAVVVVEFGVLELLALEGLAVAGLGLLVAHQQLLAQQTQGAVAVAEVT